MGKKARKSVRVQMKDGKDLFFDERNIQRIEIPNVAIERRGRRKNNRLVLDLKEDSLDMAMEKELVKKGFI